MSDSVTEPKILAEGSTSVEPILFMHLPKTAGTALRNLFALHLGEERVTKSLNMRLEDALARYDDFAAVCGHFHAERGFVLPADRVAITVLREPVDRFLSYFYFRKFDATGHTVDQRVRSRDVEQYIDEQADADIEDVNLQTLMLYPLGTESVVKVPWADRVLAAKNALDRFNLVGVHSEIDDFVSMIRARMAWPHDQALDRVNVTSQRIAPDQLSPAARKKLDTVLQFDRVVYEHALARFRHLRRASIQSSGVQRLASRATPDALPAAPVGPRKALEFGDRRVELGHIRVAGEMSGESLALIGERITLSMECITHEPLDEVSAGFIIRDDRGLVVFGTDTHLLGDVFHLAPGRYLFNFSFLNRLEAGAYSVDARLLRNGSQIDGCHHWKDNATRFDVHGWAAVPFVGRVMMDAVAQVVVSSEQGEFQTKPARAAGPPLASSSGRLNPPLRDFSATLEALTELSMVQTGSEFLVDIELGNTGVDTWRANGRRPVCLSYHWHDLDGNVIENDGLRTMLPRDVEPGQRLRVVGLLRTPQQSGRFRLIWTLVQEEVAWFDLSNGKSRCTVEVDVG